MAASDAPASPRYCVYAAALSMWLETQKDALPGNIVAAKQWLPVVDPLAGSANEVTDVVGAILWNYERFLTETTS